MTYEEKKQAINEAWELRNLCERERKKETHKECPFWNEELDDCELHIGWPSDWSIPIVTRWTPEDVALAKALKAFGVKTVYKHFDIVYWRLNTGATGALLFGAFKDLRADDREVSLDTIIKEAEGE